MNRAVTTKSTLAAAIIGAAVLFTAFLGRSFREEAENQPESRNGAALNVLTTADVEVLDLGGDPTLRSGYSAVVVRCRSNDGRAVIGTTVLLKPLDSDLPNGSFITRPTGDSDRREIRSGKYEIAQIVGDGLEERFTPDFETCSAYEIEIPAERNVLVVIPFRPVPIPTVELEFRPCVDGQPIDPGRVFWATADCRGRRVQLHANENGAFVGVCDFKVGTPSSVVSETVFELRGRGFESQRIEVKDPGAMSAKIDAHCDIRLFTGRFRGRLVDAENGYPRPRREVQLGVRQSLQNQFNVMVSVTTDESGYFEVGDVDFPCAFSVVPKEGEHFVPEGRELSLVTDPDQMVEIKHAVVSETRLRLALASVANIVGSGSTERIWLEILPLTPIRQRMRIDICDEKLLAGDAVDTLTSDGVVSVGYLPTGRYRATIVIPSLGSWSRDIDIDEDSSTNVIEPDFAKFGNTLHVDAERYGIDDGIVIEGYVPSTLAQSILMWVRPRLAQRKAEAPAIAVIEPGGEAVLTRHDRQRAMVTIVAMDGRVVHATIGRGSTAPPSDRPPLDGTLIGRVVDKEGYPVVGAIANLSSVRGGEGVDDEISPLACELREFRTDRNGEFAIDGITPGTYVFSVTELHLDHQEQSREFRYVKSSLQLVNVASGANSPMLVTIKEATVPCHCGSRHLTAEHRHREIEGEQATSRPSDRK